MFLKLLAIKQCFFPYPNYVVILNTYVARMQYFYWLFYFMLSAKFGIMLNVFVYPIANYVV